MRVGAGLSLILLVLRAPAYSDGFTALSRNRDGSDPRAEASLRMCDTVCREMRCDSSHLSDEEVQQLLAIPEPWAFVIRLGLGTGLRWSELVRAKASDVEDGFLVVSKTMNTRVRQVPLPAELEREIRQCVGLLVPRGNCWHNVQRIRRLSGVEGFRPHRMRHWYACDWLRRGGSISALQLVLGQSSVSVTERYAKLTHSAVRAEFERLESARLGQDREDTERIESRTLLTNQVAS